MSRSKKPRLSKPRVTASAKKASRTTKRRKKRDAPRIASPATPLHKPLVEAPRTQVALTQPTFFWPAFPIAMMRMWLGPRDTGVGK